LGEAAYFLKSLNNSKPWKKVKQIPKAWETMTKRINASLYFHPKRYFFLTFCPDSPNFIPFS